MHRLVLFDIDATLLLTGGAGLRAMKKASLELFGDQFSWEVRDTSGGLDSQLFLDAARHSNFRTTAEDHDAFRDRYEQHLERELEVRRENVRAMPGVHGIIETLRARPEIVLGILTGNYPGAAAIKLKAIGVDIAWFPVRAFGDDGVNRPELGKVALRRYAEVRGCSIDPARVLIVGDTPKDVDCARLNGFKVLGVGTGNFSIGDLIASGADRAAHNLLDPSPLFEMLA